MIVRVILFAVALILIVAASFVMFANTHSSRQESLKQQAEARRKMELRNALREADRRAPNRDAPLPAPSPPAAGASGTPLPLRASDVAGLREDLEAARVRAEDLARIAAEERVLVEKERKATEAEAEKIRAMRDSVRELRKEIEAVRAKRGEKVLEVVQKLKTDHAEAQMRIRELEKRIRRLEAENARLREQLPEGAE